jgi:hypothetical protein
MFTRSAADVIPTTRQAVGAKLMITMFFTAKKLIMFNVCPRGSTFNPLYLIRNIFPDLKAASLICRRQKTGSTF